MQDKTREGFQPFDDGSASDKPAIEGQAETVEEAVEPPPLSDEWPITVRLLYKPIRNGKGEEVKELVFREPTGADINRIGNPCRVDRLGEVQIDDQRMMAMLGNLSGVVTPLLERMDPRDYASCAYRLRNFFTPDTRAWFPS